MIVRRLNLEVLERRLPLAADFGDAPNPYPTLLADDGARHEAVGPMLGAARDSEVDGQPTLLADGDGSDDGVTFGTIRAGQLNASVTVNVQNAPFGAKLDAWIDFNGDGNWGGAGERIAASVSVVEGDNVIEFDVPTSIAPGETYARFRLSTVGGLNVTGFAADGEVEDYRINISPPHGTLGFISEEHLIDVPSVTNSYHVVDLDDDGDQDLISSGTRIHWLENDGAGNLTEHLVTDSIYGNYNSTTGDIDLDGDIDIVSVSTNGRMYWFENDGAQGFTQHRITTGQALPKTVNLVDWDADGDVDIIAAGPSRGFVAYVNNGNETFTEQVVIPSVIGPAIHNVYSVHPIDMDGDGDLDVVVAGRGGGGGISWYQNNGAQQFVEQSNYPIGSPSPDTSAMWPTDFDGDGDIDIAFAVSSYSTDAVGWLENNGAGYFERRLVSYDVVDPTSISVIDANGDGNVDILVFSDSRNTIDLFLGDQNHYFSKTSLADGTQGYNYSTPMIADFDGDGDLDVITSDSQRKVIWYEAFPTAYHVAASQASLIEDFALSSTITFTRTGNTSAEETFEFTVLGSASFGTDYTVVGATSFNVAAGSITFLAGERTASLTVTPLADDDFENDETIIIRITDYADLGLPSQPTNPTDAVVTILHDEPADFGDAADTYLTTAARNGPSHGITGPRLGAARDSEADGQPSELADADADDDGVTFGVLHAGQQDALVTVNVKNAPSGARLDAWFDFDGDGNFFGADEQVAVSLLLIEGDNAVPIDIPATARSGETTARFRLSTAGGLSYVGYSVDGEVEDYRVPISPPVAADGVFSARPLISANAVGSRDVVTVDLNGDGKVDMISIAENGTIHWYENQGNGQFVSHVAVQGYGGNSVKVVDLDRDGDLDLVVTQDLSVAWYENDSSQNFTHRPLTGYLPNAVEVYAVDLDSDGDLDIVALGSHVSSTGAIGWFENDGNENFSGMRTIGSTEGTRAIAIGDINQDGHVDIVARAYDGPWHRIALFINDGDGNFSKALLASSVPVPNIHSIAIADLDGDGDSEIVWASPSIMWIENLGDGSFSESLNIIPGTQAVTQLRPVDVNGDGSFDLLVTDDSSNMAAWYKNDGAAKPTFTRIEVGPTGHTPWAVSTGDLDGDGDLDVVTASRGDNRIDWFESISSNTGDFDGDGDVDGRDFLAWQRGASPKKLAANDLADWQATYGYTEPEPPAVMDIESTQPDSPVAGLAAVDGVLAEAVIDEVFILPPVTKPQVSRREPLLEQRLAIEHPFDRAFADLGEPSRSFVRDFGDLATRRAVRPRVAMLAFGLDE